MPDFFYPLCLQFSFYENVFVLCYHSLAVADVNIFFRCKQHTLSVVSISAWATFSLHAAFSPACRPETVNQHCCYGDDLELLDIREGGGGSLLDRLHFRSHGNGAVPWMSYLQEDVAPYLHCCQFTTNRTLCESFAQKRPPVSCQGYYPPAAGNCTVFSLCLNCVLFCWWWCYTLLQSSSAGSTVVCADIKKKP